MSRDPESLSHHPAPHAERLSTGMAWFMLFGGPLAWLVQLSIGYMLVSWPCFPSGDKLAAPLAGYGWTGSAALIALFLAVVVAAAAGYTSWGKLREVRDEKEGGHADLMDVGHGRTRFVALWGAFLGGGFAVTTLVTLLGFVLVPRCLG